MDSSFPFHSLVCFISFDISKQNNSAVMFWIYLSLRPRGLPSEFAWAFNPSGYLN
ncbi:MAG: hypothetical protein ACTS6P_02090 [Candidatus Hodgkinia cicadicola]